MRSSQDQQSETLSFIWFQFNPLTLGVPKKAMHTKTNLQLETVQVCMTL